MRQVNLLLGFLFGMEGVATRQSGAGAETNPYESGTEEHRLWREGWEEANREACDETGFGGQPPMVF